MMAPIQIVSPASRKITQDIYSKKTTSVPQKLVGND